MSKKNLPQEMPLVSVVLTTRDRPRLLPLALSCYQQQRYPRRELILVDDGDAFPTEEGPVAALGGRILRAKPGTPLGIKLNLGAEASRGSLIMKMDDDDYYAANYLDTMVSEMMLGSALACEPTLAFLRGFLFFDVARWEVRRSIENNVPGATFLFFRTDWREHPFRPLPTDEDNWYLADHASAGGVVLPIRAREIFVAVRHGQHKGTRGHTWTHQGDGRRLEDYLTERPVHETGPEALFPEWALGVYRELRQEMTDASPQPRESELQPTERELPTDAPTSVS